ncbi:MAG: hypothetical protein ACLP50_24220, partial [Solirubrobacteraceae bacterium]
LTIDHFTSVDADRFTDRPRLKVMMSVDHSQFGDTELAHARWVLAVWQHDSHAPWPQVSDAALKVWLAARDRQRRAAVHTSTKSERLITIDGSPEPFLTLTPPSGRWVAIRRHEGITITIAGRDLDPTTLTLEPIPDPAARLSAQSPRSREAGQQRSAPPRDVRDRGSRRATRLLARGGTGCAVSHAMALRTLYIRIRRGRSYCDRNQADPDRTGPPNRFSGARTTARAPDAARLS